MRLDDTCCVDVWVWLRVDVCCLLCCVLLCVVCECMSDNALGAEGGAAVAEAMKSCKQLTSVNLRGMSCLCAVCVCVCLRCLSQL